MVFNFKSSRRVYGGTHISPLLKNKNQICLPYYKVKLEKKKKYNLTINDEQTSRGGEFYVVDITTIVWFNVCA